MQTHTHIISLSLSHTHIDKQTNKQKMNGDPNALCHYRVALQSRSLRTAQQMKWLPQLNVFVEDLIQTTIFHPHWNEMIWAFFQWYLKLFDMIRRWSTLDFLLFDNKLWIVVNLCRFCYFFFLKVHLHSPRYQCRYELFRPECLLRLTIGKIWHWCDDGGLEGRKGGGDDLSVRFRLWMMQMHITNELWTFRERRDHCKKSEWILLNVCFSLHMAGLT